MRLEMGGERIERAFNVRLVTVRRRRAAETFDPGAPLRILAEKTVHVSAGHAAVHRDGAVDAAVVEPHQRARGGGARAPPHMHLVALDRDAVADRLAGNL